MVGHWLKGDLGHDRKDISGLIKVFYETFKLTKEKTIIGYKNKWSGLFSYRQKRYKK